MKSLHKLLLLCVPALFSSCSLFGPPVPPPKATHVMYEWYDDQGPGEVALNINLTIQKARITRGGRPIGWCFVSTGKEGRGTPAGNYKVMEKVVDKFSNKYGWISDATGCLVTADATPITPLRPGDVYHPSEMKYWQRLTSYGIGMHVGPIPKPGEPASHGCIRMPEEFKPILFEVTKVGTPVKITYGPADFWPASPAALAQTLNGTR